MAAHVLNRIIPTQSVPGAFLNEQGDQLGGAWRWWWQQLGGEWLGRKESCLVHRLLPSADHWAVLPLRSSYTWSHGKLTCLNEQFLITFPHWIFIFIIKSGHTWYADCTCTISHEFFGWRRRNAPTKLISSERAAPGHWPRQTHFSNCEQTHVHPSYGKPWASRGQRSY